MPTDEPVPTPERPVPLCLHCLQPYDPLLHHYCPNCYNAVGQLTPNIPFVNIPFQCEFWSRLWQLLWSPRRGHLLLRLAAALLIFLFVPILLAGIPFALFRRSPTPRPAGSSSAPLPLELPFEKFPDDELPPDSDAEPR
jgi:hypothetical protein